MLKFSGCSCLISGAEIEEFLILNACYNIKLCDSRALVPTKSLMKVTTSSDRTRSHASIFNERNHKLIWLQSHSDVWGQSIHTETNMLKGYPFSAGCVQRSDDSRNSAIRIAYRISLRSSSIWEPRYPSLKIFLDLFLNFLLYLINKIISSKNKLVFD